MSSDASRRCEGLPKLQKLFSAANGLIRHKIRSPRWRECRSASKTCLAAMSWRALAGMTSLRLRHNCRRQ